MNRFVLRICSIATVSTLFCCIGAASAWGASQTLNYVAAETGLDNGPQDGIFDAFTVLNFGSLDDNGYTSFRTAVEFQLPVVPQGKTIRSAVLRGFVSNFEGTRSVAVYGYVGDGTIQLADFAGGQILATFSVTPNTVPFAIDVTPLVATLAGANQGFVGFGFREEPANAFNYTVMGLLVNSWPTLTISFESPAAQVPATGPLALFLMSAAIFLVVAWSMRGRAK